MVYGLNEKYFLDVIAYQAMVSFVSLSSLASLVSFLGFGGLYL